METGRGRSSKKPWHLTLRLTEVIFAVFGMLGLLMMSFTLGVLAGRGISIGWLTPWGCWFRSPSRRPRESPRWG